MFAVKVKYLFIYLFIYCGKQIMDINLRVVQTPSGPLQICVYQPTTYTLNIDIDSSLNYQLIFYNDILGRKGTRSPRNYEEIITDEIDYILVAKDEFFQRGNAYVIVVRKATDLFMASGAVRALIEGDGEVAFLLFHNSLQAITSAEFWIGSAPLAEARRFRELIDQGMLTFALFYLDEEISDYRIRVTA